MVLTYIVLITSLLPLFLLFFPGLVVGLSFSELKQEAASLAGFQFLMEQVVPLQES